jgi:hypothetical protein
MGAIFAIRVLYTDLCNRALEAQGHTARLNPHRLDARGITRTPEPRLKPSDSNARKFHGETTPRMDEVLRHRAARQPQDEAEQLEARAAWILRKRALGITPEMTPEEQRQRIMAARQAAHDQKPTRQTPEDAKRHLADLTAEERHLVRLAAALRIERLTEERLAAQGKERDPAGKRRLVALLAEARHPGKATRVLRQTTSSRLARRTRSAARKSSSQQQGEPIGAALRVRLDDEDARRQAARQAQAVDL